MPGKNTEYARVLHNEFCFLAAVVSIKDIKKKGGKFSLKIYG